MAEPAGPQEREGLRSLDELTFRKRPHLRDAPLSRRDGLMWADLRYEFLRRCDGARTFTAIANDMARMCSSRTVKRIKAEMLALGLIEEVPIPGMRGRPRLLRRTDGGDVAAGQELRALRSVLHAHSPTVREMRAIRQGRLGDT